MARRCLSLDFEREFVRQHYETAIYENNPEVYVEILQRYPEFLCQLENVDWCRVDPAVVQHMWQLGASLPDSEIMIKGISSLCLGEQE